MTTCWAKEWSSVNFKKVAIISSIFSDHSPMRLEINYRQKKKNKNKKKIKKQKHMEAKQYVTKQPMDHWKNQRGNFKDT